MRQKDVAPTPTEFLEEIESLLRLLIVTFDPPQNIGGVEGRVQGYVTELMKRGGFVEVETFAPGYHFTDEIFYGASLHKCPSDSGALLSSFPYTLGLIGRDSLDSVFLLSGGVTLFGNILLLYCRMRGKRSAMLLYGKDILQAAQEPSRKDSPLLLSTPDGPHRDQLPIYLLSVTLILPEEDRASLPEHRFKASTHGRGGILDQKRQNPVRRQARKEEGRGRFDSRVSTRVGGPSDGTAGDCGRRP